MRLLNVSTHHLEEFFEPHVPPYVILSHRWEDEEVLFSDITGEKRGLEKMESVFSGANNYKQKKGFKKIKLVCQAAIEINLKYVWIDTCCIDKSSSAELSEAITSMFVWYRNSRFCYAYLSDIECAPGDEIITSSVWFDRGWTLQELIAPDIVMFYDSTGRKIGSRDLLSTQISRKTRIPEKVFSGMLDRMLLESTAAQKMSWAASRRTTRIEDRAYSLIGIFGVSMPLLYGEGARAFTRLQEEILRTGTDLSILSWSWNGEEVTDGRRSLLAQSPDDFYDCEDIVESLPAPGMMSADTTFAMTNQGLRIKRPPVVKFPSADDDTKVALSLGCRKSSDLNGVLALKVQVTGSVAGIKTPVSIKKPVCHVGWLSDRIGCDPRIARVTFFEPVVLEDWSTVTISRMRPQLSGQKFSDISTHPHKYVWLQLPVKDTWTTWEALSYWPDVGPWTNADWNPQTMTCRMEAGDGGRWNDTAILLGSHLGEGFFIHLRCNAQLSTVSTNMSACGPGWHKRRRAGVSFSSLGVRFRADTAYRSGSIELAISPSCRVKLVPHRLSRYGETINQLQIQIERPQSNSVTSTIEAAAYPDIPTYLPQWIILLFNVHSR